MAQSKSRVKIYTPRTPLLLRPEFWLAVAVLGYFTFEKVAFHGPLAYEQNFPRGLSRELSSRFEGFLVEQGVGPQSWAIPINDFLKSGGQCLRVIPGPEENPARTSLGGAVTFTLPLPAETGAGAVDATFVCQEEKADKFFVTLVGKSIARMERGYGLPMAIDLEEGQAKIKALPGARLELLVPNGALTLSTEKGFEAVIARDGGAVIVSVNSGTAEAESRFAANYLGESLGFELRAEDKGRIKVPGKGAAGAGKVFRAVPSGFYAQAK